MVNGFALGNQLLDFLAFIIQNSRYRSFSLCPMRYALSQFASNLYCFELSAPSVSLLYSAFRIPHSNPFAHS